MKNRIPQSFIQDVVARTNIVPLIESRVELKKRGNTYTACCPFHSEKTPSFTVSESKQFYYCFGCGASGNAISFLMNYDRLEFLDALSTLAEPLNLTLPTDTPPDQPTLKHLYPLLEKTKKCYQQALTAHPNAINYLKSRGLSGETARDFAIGYAPAGWDFITKLLGTNKQSLADLVTTGMSIEKTSTRHYDRFRDRIMFPIRDMRGRTIAFGGRTLGDDTPKYLNSPETPIFHKNSILYGLFEACKQGRKLNKALVVEGYMDVISLAQHGISYAVATLGTALNVKHIHILLRHTEEIIFCFDGDRAGKNAAWKALNISLPLLRDGIEFKFLFLTNKDDPDTAVQRLGKSGFEKAIDNAQSLSEVFFQQLENDHPLTSIGSKASFAQAAKKALSTMPAGIYKSLLLKQLAEKVTLPPELLTPHPKTRDIKTPSPQPKIDSGFSLPQKGKRLAPAARAIQLLLAQPSLAKETKPNMIETLPTSQEINLLKQLISRFHTAPETSVGELLIDFKDKTTCAYLAALSTMELQIPETGIQAEYQGVLKTLADNHKKVSLNQLIEKAKHTALSSFEKQQLQQLLKEKNSSLDT